MPRASAAGRFEMAGSVADQRRRGRAAAAAIVALTIHLVALGFLTISSPGLFSGPPEVRAISVDLVAPPERLTLRSRPLSRSAPPKQSPNSLPSVEAVHPTGPPPPDVAPRPAAADTSQASKPAGLALRNSVIGCAFAATLGLSESERRHCHDMFAAGRKGAPDLSGLALDPVKKAAFDAAAEREKFLQKPFLSERPKNGCKPFVDHQQYATLGSSRDAYSMSFGCGKSF